jgi:hypothetical protein
MHCHLHQHGRLHNAPKLGVPILWKQKAQRSPTLSSAEAEFAAYSKAAKEIKFVAQILNDMGIKVKFPITIQVYK